MVVEQLAIPVEDGSPIEEVLLAHPNLEAYGSDFLNLAGQLSTEHPEIADAYFTLYERLALQAGNTAWMFPESERDQARQATIELFGNTIGTVLNHHAAGNETQAEVVLKGRPAARVDLYGTEPLMILDSLSQAYWVAGEVMTNRPNDTVRSVLATEGPGYNLYRFIDTAPDPYLPPCTTLYIRGRASEAYDPEQEYGNGRGVEASVQLRIDLKLLREHMNGRDTKMISLANSRKANDGVVCLRVDRSGVEIETADGKVRRLPTTPAGSASHDVGSVLRDGVRGIGRFLAINHQDLNHLPIADTYGGDDAFEAYANELDARVKEKQIQTPKLRHILRKQQLGRLTFRGFPAFELGQNPYDIPGVRGLAAYSGVELSAEPNDAEIQQLFKLWGSQKAFQYNILRMHNTVPQLDYEQLARFVDETGILGAMALRTVFAPQPKVTGVSHGLIMEGVAPWIHKRAAYMREMQERGVRIGTVILGATRRPLDTPTEVAHPDVVALHRRLRRQPDAVDFMYGPVREQLIAAGIRDVEVVGLPYKQAQPDGSTRVTSGKEVAEAIVAAHPEIVDGSVLNALNAPAGGMFSGTLEALANASPAFNAEQFLMGHGRTYMARSYEENVTTRLFQNTFSAPSSLVRWIDAMYKVNKRFPKA